MKNSSNKRLKKRARELRKQAQERGLVKKLSDIDFKSEEYKDFVCHLDELYARKFLGKGGSAFSYDDGGPLRIDYIYGKSRLQIWFINILLRVRYLKRKWTRK